MKIHLPYLTGKRGDAAFTMVEIALSIAVVAFALVAIIGVLPTGMTVQRENRDDTIINQEGRYWLEAIKSGARGLDDLTNYVEAIRIGGIEISNTLAKPLTGEQIIGLLTMPLPPLPSATNNTNRVVARVKAITGPASEKGGLTNEFSFRYELVVDVKAHSIMPQNLINATGNPFVRQGLDQQKRMIEHNLKDVRLVLRWPLFERGNRWVAGNGRKSFRAQIAGTLIMTNFANLAAGAFVEPNKFAYVQPSTSP